MPETECQNVWDGGGSQTRLYMWASLEIIRQSKGHVLFQKRKMHKIILQIYTSTTSTHDCYMNKYSITSYFHSGNRKWCLFSEKWNKWIKRLIFTGDEWVVSQRHISIKGHSVWRKSVN